MNTPNPNDPSIIKLYQFRFYDEVRKRWFRARYRAELQEIHARYAKFEVIGEPELRRRCDPNQIGHGG